MIFPRYLYGISIVPKLPLIIMEVQIGTFTVHRHAYRYEQKFLQLGTCDISLYLHSAVDVVQLLIHDFRCQGRYKIASYVEIADGRAVLFKY